MRNVIAVVGLLLVVGCASKDPGGSSGGSSGGGGQGLVWVDRTGAVVGPDVGGPVYFDSSGFMWAVGVNTGALRPPLVGVLSFYDDSACSHLVGVAQPDMELPPREVFALTPGDGGFFVRSDTAQFGVDAGQLFAFAGASGCSPEGSVGSAVLPITGMVAVTPPATPFAPPLHPQWRGASP